MNLLQLFSKLPIMSFLNRFKIIAALVVVLLLVWTVGGVFGLSFNVQLIISLVIFVGYAAVKAGQFWHGQHQNNNINKSSVAKEQDGGVDLLPLRKNVAAAINTLCTSELGQNYHGHGALYALPWFIMLGASGAGKSTLLRNAGLQFPLNSDEEIELKGFGGTKNLDWWFADDAVILDTAGRYTTNTDAHDEWLGLLNIIRRNRWRMPLNGVLLTLSLHDILLADTRALEQQAGVLRDRIADLNTQLGYVLPITLIFNKADLISGFSQLFAGCKADQQQEWGVSLHALARDENINESLKQQLACLQQRLVNYAVQHLDYQGNNGAKAKAFNFATHFQRVLSRVEDFVFMMTHDNPYQAKFNLRGVYFTSANQQGLSLTSLVREGKTQFVQSAGAIPKKQAHNCGQGFFITALLKKSVFTDKNSAVMNQRTRALVNGVKYGVSGLVGAALLSMVIFWGVAYAFNHDVLNQSVEKVAHLSSVVQDSQADQWDLLSAQLTVLQQFNEFSQHNQLIAAHKRFGLYRGNDQQFSLQSVLADSLQNNFLFPVAKVYEAKLHHYAALWPKLSGAQQQKMYFYYYQTLRNYLQLGIYDANNTPSDIEDITNTWVNLLAKQKNNIDDSMLNTAQLAHLVTFFLNNPNSGISPDSLAVEWLPKRNLISTAREQLRRPVDVSLLNTKLQQILQTKLPAISIDSLLPGSTANLFADTVALPGMYTKLAWLKIVAPQITSIANQASAGDWVINQPISINQDGALKPAIDNTKPDLQVAAKLQAQMLQGYFQAYLQAWYQWMTNLRLKKFSSLSDASDALIQLSKDDGPMVKVLQTIANNLQIKDPDSHWRLFSKNNEAPVIYKSLTGTDNFISSDLSVKLTDAMKQYLQAIQSVQADVENIAVSSDQEQGADKYSRAILSGSTNANNLFQARLKISQLLENANNKVAQGALSNVLLAPLRASWQALLMSAQKNIQRNWQAQIIPSFENEIAGKVPFAASGPDIDMAPVQSFFAPKSGSYWQFVNKQLVPYVQQEGLSWQLNTWLGIGMPLSADFMSNLQQAQQISSVLFSNGTSTQKFFYSLYPIPEPRISELDFTVNNQQFSYVNGPQQWHYYHWAASQNPQQAVLTVVENDGEARARMYEGGPWALFKLLRKADSLQRHGNYYIAKWSLQSSTGNTLHNVLHFRTDGPADAIAAFVTHDFKPPYMLAAKQEQNL
jgi:type VI secretion system protein ImpL